MSIERNRSSESIDTARTRELLKQPKVEPRQPPSPENVDEFRAVMKQQREGEYQQQSLQSQARQHGRATDAQNAEQTATDVAVQAKGLADTVEDNARRRGDDLGTSASSLQSADASAMFQAQMAMREGAHAAPPQAAPAASPQGLAELIERHVRQLAVGEGAERDSDGRVLLRMADATLPGTDLLLSRSADGWTLRADVRSRSSYDAIREAAPELTKRFAERNLGNLSIDPHFHD